MAGFTPASLPFVLCLRSIPPPAAFGEALHIHLVAGLAHFAGIVFEKVRGGKRFMRGDVYTAANRRHEVRAAPDRVYRRLDLLRGVNGLYGHRRFIAEALHPPVCLAVVVSLI